MGHWANSRGMHGAQTLYCIWFLLDASVCSAVKKISLALRGFWIYSCSLISQEYIVQCEDWNPVLTGLSDIACQAVLWWALRRHQLHSSEVMRPSGEHDSVGGRLEACDRREMSFTKVKPQCSEASTSKHMNLECSSWSCHCLFIKRLSFKRYELTN